jgi:hypothetical protein
MHNTVLLLSRTEGNLIKLMLPQLVVTVVVVVVVPIGLSLVI